MTQSFRLPSAMFCALACLQLSAAAGTPPQDPATNFGPYNLTFLEGGIGMTRTLSGDTSVLSGAWSMSGWLSETVEQSGDVLVAALGERSRDCRCIVISEGHLQARAGSASVTSQTRLRAGSWHAVAATYDGHELRLFVDGEPAGSDLARAQGTPADPVLRLAPVGTGTHFGGSLAQFKLHAAVLGPQQIREQAGRTPDFGLIVFQTVGAGWPWQEHAWRGLLVPQDPWTLPRSNTPPSRPVATEAPSAPALESTGDRSWTVGAWKLAEAPKVPADGSLISLPEFDDTGWYPAVVPGTVLTTLIARGVYPDPTYGLNNMAIPESLNRQHYWYRTRFDAPAAATAKRFTLVFNGINYSADVWMNGSRLGQIRGAFTRGVFDVTDLLRAGRTNVLAVRISPPPHPGIPHEESIAAGPGENGGNLAIDGPTFVATEGWDWIPAIRDRNSGLWQNVELRASGRVRLLDPHIVTRLPLPNIASADVFIDVPVESTVAAPATLEARFEGVSVRKSLTLKPGIAQIRLTPEEFPQLHLLKPRLWWPNGYGKPELYRLTLTVSQENRISDSQSLRFGIRHITYELSLFDHSGRLRRVEVDPTAGSARSERLVDVRHEAIKKTPNGWAESLTSAGENSPAVHEIASRSLDPYLVIRVNGVPIAVRGGSWGTDDLLKRVSRDRLEPYFRLHQAANLNIIRNWLGQNTEEVFYDLADQYGLLVLNDFWDSTQDFQVEPEDPQLFLANAREVLLRFRNHPSIAVWFGRNEGVPQPILNEGLADLIATLDGTRHYTGSSNSVNLQGSGPYNYRPPEQYFTELARGFSVEVGTPSLSTLESLQASIAPADRWPISDTLAYHDWHFGGNGDVATFMASLQRQFGAPTSLEDFERKAQMMNYDSYRAVFEGFQAHLWTRNSGRLLWMTHPAWPSNHWQIYSSDYDTHASYYGVKSACEPVHVQMNLPDFSLAVVNTTLQARPRLTVTSRIISLDGRLLERRVQKVAAPANSTTTLPVLNLLPRLQEESLVLVVLTLEEPGGTRLSQNIYWQALDEASHRKLNTLAPQPVVGTAQVVPEGAGTLIQVELRNRGNIPALATKLTVVDVDGSRSLPVLYSDNYLTLLPGEPRKVDIRCPAGTRCARVQIRGWNVLPGAIDLPVASRRGGG